MVKPSPRTKSIGTKVTEEEYEVAHNARVSQVEEFALPWIWFGERPEPQLEHTKSGVHEEVCGKSGFERSTAAM